MLGSLFVEGDDVGQPPCRGRRCWAFMRLKPPNNTALKSGSTALDQCRRTMEKIHSRRRAPGPKRRPCTKPPD